MNGFYPQINFNSQMPRINNNMTYGRISNIDDTQKTESFTDVLHSMVNNVNAQMNKPDELLSQAASGNSEVDVHDVMVAMSQAEITLTVATNAITKVIQAYDKITQIQV